MKVEEFDRLTKVPKLSPGRKKDKENPVQKVPDFSSAELQKDEWPAVVGRRLVLLLNQSEYYSGANARVHVFHN